MTFSGAVGFNQTCGVAANFDFSGNIPQQLSQGLVANAEVWMGRTALNSGGTHIDVVTLTAGTGVTFTQTFGANPTFTIGLTGGGTVVETLTPNSGTSPVTPTGGTINVVGIGSTTTVGSLNTLTVELTGLTNHAVLVGAGTTTITKVGPSASTGQILQNNAGADPSYSTATYPSTTTINQILYSSAANVVSGLATANNGVLTTGTTGIPVITALASNGQLIIGSGSGAPAAATLTAGNGVTITNAANSITIAANGSAFAYTNVNHAASPYTVLTTDYYISVDCSAGVVTLKFPNAPTANQIWIVKDRTGNASTNNISVTTVGGSVTIDGQTTYTIAGNYGSIELLYNGTNYEVF